MDYRSALGFSARVLATDLDPLVGGGSSSLQSNSAEADSSLRSNSTGGGGLSSTVMGSSDFALHLVSHRLNEHNYLQWSRSMLMIIRGRQKERYLTWVPPPPNPTEPTYDKWCAENNLVMAWLIHSMMPDISENYLLSTSAKEIWDSVKMMYSVKENTAAIFQVKRQLRPLIQGDFTVTQFFSALKRLWQQIDLYEVHTWSCTKDELYYKQLVDRERCYEFLLGLKDSFEDARGRIMSVKPLPTLEEAFNIIKCEESRKVLTQTHMGPSSVPISSPEVSALAVRSTPEESKGNKSGRWCDHCHKKGHTREICWKLHGKPSKQKPRSDGKGMMVGPALSENGSLSTEELFVLRKILDKHGNQLASPGETHAPSVTLAQAGTALTQALSSASSKNIWIVDSGATDHILGFKDLFSEFTEFKEHDVVEVANGQFAKVMGTGTVIISEKIVLKNVFYVPEIKCSLLSVRRIVHQINCLVIFDKFGCDFQDLALGGMIGNAKEWHGLYYLHGNSPKACISHASMSMDDVQLWHSRLGHPSLSYLQTLFPNISNKIIADFHCETCHFAKQTRNSYPSHSYNPTKPFTLIHSDVWGPSKLETNSKARWFVSFIDDHTRLTWIFLMRNKSEVFSIFKQFYTFVKTQFHTKIQILRSDNGKEYLNSQFTEFCNLHGLQHQTSCAYSPQQNGVSERKNRHLLEVARALMMHSNVPNHFWGDAVLTAAYLINRMPSKTLNFSTPLQKFLENFPNSPLISSIPPKVFGCTVFVYNEGGGKLDTRALKCIFLGYSSSQKGYKCFSPSNNKVYVTMNVKFLENQPFFPKSPIQGEMTSEISKYEWIICETEQDFSHTSNQHEPHTSRPPHTSNQHFQSNSFFPTTNSENSLDNFHSLPTSTDPSSTRSRFQDINPFEPLNFISETSSAETMVTEPSDTSEQQINEYESIATTRQSQESAPEPSLEDLHWPIALRKGKRSCTQHPIGRYVSYKKLSPHLRTFVANVEKVKIPNSYEEAVTDPKWRKAIDDELQALHKNKTWKLTELPKGKTIVSSKWVFTIKYNSDGTINKYKARLVARGFTQTYGIDYQETFAPVAKLNTVNVLLSIAANLDWSLHQLDVKNAFLNGDLKEEVYMEVPQGLRNVGNSNKVCRLYKSLYGLKQSPRAWFDKLNQAIKKQGYTQCQADDTLFVKHCGSKITALIVYVDDIVVTGNDTEEIVNLKEKLAAEFDIKDLGNLRYFLGMEVARTEKGISMSQRKYIIDLLKETGMLGARPAHTPMELNQKLKIRPDGKAVDKERYQKLVGKLIYLSHTRPDICYPVSVVSQFSSNPQTEHMTAVYWILRYLKKTPGQGLFFEKGDSRSIDMFTDADWGGSKSDRRSTTGYCSYVWGNLVTWRSKKQPVVSRSSAESEYRALSLGVCEGMWLIRLLREMKMDVNSPVRVWCDNMSAIKIAKNPIQHDRMKHVEIDRHFIREKIEDKIIDLAYIPSGQQIADVMTKSLTQDKFEGFRSKLGMINIYSPA